MRDLPTPLTRTIPRFEFCGSASYALGVPFYLSLLPSRKRGNSLRRINKRKVVDTIRYGDGRGIGGGLRGISEMDRSFNFSVHGARCVCFVVYRERDFPSGLTNRQDWQALQVLLN